MYGNIIIYIGGYKEHGVSLGGSYLWRQLTGVIRDIGKGQWRQLTRVIRDIGKGQWRFNMVVLRTRNRIVRD